MIDSTGYINEGSYACCPKCNHLNPIKVGPDARMHDKFRYRCLECGAESVCSVIMRGAQPSPIWSRVAPATPCHLDESYGGDTG